MKKYALLTLALVVATATAAVAGVHVVGGTWTGGNTIPFWAAGQPYYPQMRFQCLWRQTDIMEAGYVSKIEWLTYPRVTQGGTFNGCKFLLCHTTLATLTNNYANNYTGNTPVTIYSGNFVHPAVPGNTWYTIAEPTTTLDYNNKDNLLFEISWTSYTGGGRNDYRCRSTGGQGGRLYAASATATTGTLDAGYAQHGRLTIGFVGVAPTSLGRVKSIFK
jgi:hypothetical protein